MARGQAGVAAENAITFHILCAVDAEGLPRDPSTRFHFRVPSHWRSPVFKNPHAGQAEREVLTWFESLGCDPKELRRAQKFDAAGYVGIPFPTLSQEMTIRIGKYLSMWLLWDDVQIECLQNRWRITAEHVLRKRLPDGATRFDLGWW